MISIDKTIRTRLVENTMENWTIGFLQDLLDEAKRLGLSDNAQVEFLNTTVESNGRTRVISTKVQIARSEVAV